MENPWTTLSTRKVYENAWIGVREDQVVRPDGEPGIYGVISFKNTAVGVIAYEDEHIYLVGQFRYPLNVYSWEIPEGGCPDGELPIEAAKRELREETGIVADNWKTMGTTHLSNSVSDEVAYWFFASGLTHLESRPEACEVLETQRIHVDEAIRMARTGEITDAISMLAIMQFALEREELIRFGEV